LQGDVPPGVTVSIIHGMDDEVLSRDCLCYYDLPEPSFSHPFDMTYDITCLD
jgi:hypothetical protein